MSYNTATVKSDPIATAVFQALAGGEKCLCELKEIIGIPQTWESYDLAMLEGLNAISSRTANGYRYYSLAPSRSLWYLRRSFERESGELPAGRSAVRYESAIEQVRQSVPGMSGFEAVLRRGC